MYVCVCQAVTERQVREAVEQGISSMRGLREQLGVQNYLQSAMGSIAS